MIELGTNPKYQRRSHILIFLGLSLFILGSLIVPSWAQSAEALSYNQFETDVKAAAYNTAHFDGNILTLGTTDGKRFYTIAPEVGRAVGLLVKFKVPVTAQALPSSGLTWPMTILLLIPYGILSFYAFALAKAARAAGSPLAESTSLASAPSATDQPEEDEESEPSTR